jgi:hypothetical protein
LFAGALFLGPAPARASGTDENSAPTTPKPQSESQIRALFGLAAVYAYHGGSEFDGRHTQLFDANRAAHIPKLYGGFGVRPTVGVIAEKLLPRLSLSASANFEFTKHQAISYSVDNAWYAHENAAHKVLGLEFRGILEMAKLKPFIGITPGYAWLSLPAGITVIDPATRNTTWSDVTLRGFSFEASLGLIYELISIVTADASVGYRLQSYSSSSSGALSGFGYSPGWVASLGVELRS